MSVARKITNDELHIHIKNIKLDGYTVIKDYIPGNKADKLKQIAGDLYKDLELKLNQKAPVGLQHVIKDDYIINNIPCLSSDYLDICTTGDHLEVLKFFLNDPYYSLIPKNDPNFTLAQANLRAGKVSLSFHVDVRLVTPGYESWSYQGYLALEKIQKKSGCLRVIPKSHLLPQMPDSTKEYNNAIDLPLDQGDIIIFSSQLHHATHKCEKDVATPWTLLLTYRSWWCKQQFDFLKMIDPNVFKNLNNNQKLLLGACSQIPDNIYASPSSRQGYEALDNFSR